MEIRDTVLDFNKVCRLCLSEETVMSSIFTEADSLSNSVPLPLRIMACVSVEISSTDGLPSQICATCLCQVDGWYKFKDLCENADSILRKYVKNEPVQVESISHIQNLAEEVKNYFSFSQSIKEEANGGVQNQCETPKKKLKTVENTNGESIELYSLPKFETRSAPSNVPHIKEEENNEDEVEDDDDDDDDDYEDDGEGGEDDEEDKFASNDVCTYGSDSEENPRDSCDIEEALTSRTSEATPDSDDADSQDDYSSDDNITLSAKKKKLLNEKNKLKTKKKLTLKQETPGIAVDVVKHARTVQTQTGADDDFTLEEVIETSLSNGLDEMITSMDKKKIKSRKTQTPKEKSAPKKRFRIRPAAPTSCTLCGRVYKNNEILRQHMKSHHVTGSIECPNCKLTFTSLRSLKYHEQRKHSNLEPVPCTFCGKKFLDKKYLRIHENIHSQANQYVCQFCGRKFIMKTNLTVHISRHHTLKTNDFICQVCGKAFPFKLYLKKHFKTHTDYKPYQCSYCEAKFRENTLLRQHVNSIHLKLRPFLCQYCHKTFTRSLYLREHMESQHLGIQKKIECSRCGQNFQNRNRLRQHECEGRLEAL